MRALLLSVFVLLSFASVVAQHAVNVVVKPSVVYIERGEHQNHLNFDLLISNTSADSLLLVKIAVSLQDKNHRPAYTRFLDANGTAPSIKTIPDTMLKPFGSLLLFNPLTDFDTALPLDRVVYELTFSDPAGQHEFSVSTTVSPREFSSPQLRFPLSGTVLVYDGHDYYAHHRRFDYEFEPIKQLGIKANFMRYAYDFVLLDAQNKQFGGTGKDEDYFGYAKAVYAVGAGKVIYASNTHKDDKTFDIPKIATDALELYGNCIAIEHTDHSVSIYGHLKQNSLKVKTGDIARQGQQIGAIGVSGSSFFPHLHFELRTSIQSDAEGLPSYFSNISTQHGNGKTHLKSGLAETGMILVTD